MAATSQDPHVNSSYSGPAKEVKDDVDALRSDIASLASSVSKLASEKVGGAAGEAQATYLSLHLRSPSEPTHTIYNAASRRPASASSAADA